MLFVFEWNKKHNKREREKFLRSYLTWTFSYITQASSHACHTQLFKNEYKPNATESTCVWRTKRTNNKNNNRQHNKKMTNRKFKWSIRFCFEWLLGRCSIFFSSLWGVHCSMAYDYRRIHFHFSVYASHISMVVIKQKAKYMFLISAWFLEMKFQQQHTHKLYFLAAFFGCICVCVFFLYSPSLLRSELQISWSHVLHNQIRAKTSTQREREKELKNVVKYKCVFQLHRFWHAKIKKLSSFKSYFNRLKIQIP